MIIDTHAHLYYDNIATYLDEILQRAVDSGIERIIVPAVDLKTSKNIIQLSEKHDIIYCAVGFHPTDVQKASLSDIDELEKLTFHEKVVAIGETGLDYYWDKSSIDIQKEFFNMQIDLAKDKGLPIVIHTRDSTEDAIEMISNKYDNSLSGQFHCFGGTITDAEKVLEMNNFYISFCGNVTFKNFKELDVVEYIPSTRMLSETDSPFLTPVPNRGKENEPSNIVYTIKKIAEVKQMDEEELKKDLYQNAKNLFKKLT